MDTLMQTITSTSELRQVIQAYKQAGKSIAFVPTMGNLHEGHLSLIDAAKTHADIVVASIFVNPMQFGENEDLDAYPRTLEADSEGLSSRGCQILFAPSANEVYPNGTQAETRVDVPSLVNHHCGASRPGHFIGVATVVSKLFNMVQADVAVFGEKDFQQLAVIRKMAQDLCMPIRIIGVPISREPSGLARSSRNGYLTPEEKTAAAKIYQTLLRCKQALEAGERNFENLSNTAINELEAGGFKKDYFNMANPITLEVATANDNECVILAAAWLGNTRLIDNISVSLIANRQ
jgi:pantoate--beta-alanine ligase